MKSALLLASLTAGALALPPQTTHVLHQRRSPAQEARFTKHSAVSGDTRIPLQIALKQGNLQEAENRLYDISNPKSPNYGKHLSKAEVVNMFAADDASINSVKEWLNSYGVDPNDIYVNPTKTWIKVDAPANLLEKALHARYHVYRGLADDKQRDHVGVDHYSLPSHISNIVDFILPGTKPTQLLLARQSGNKGPDNNSVKPAAIGEPLRSLSQDDIQIIKDVVAKSSESGKGNSSMSSSLDHCGSFITPNCIAHLYKIPPPTASNLTNRLGLFESLNDVYSQEDLDLFFRIVAPNIPAGTGPELDLINGVTAPNPPRTAGGESLLDFDMAYPIIYPQGITLFQVRTDENSNIFGDFLSAVDRDYCIHDPFFNKHKTCGQFQPTNVVSISYGGTEEPDDVEYAHRICNEMMKLGLIGVTVVVASGDAGVSNQANTCFGPHHDVFVPSDLVSCPYVTAVGSTVLNAINEPEVATTSFSSGGGFSNIFPRPPWQEEAVGDYLLHHNPGYFAYNVTNGAIPNDGGIYNRGGRGFPDVAALGDNGVVAESGSLSLSGGTSMSAPIVAAILNRINERRLSVGKGPIGFANPALYNLAREATNNPKRQAAAFHDITVGDQALGGAWSDRGYSACGNKGFSCVEGWDPVTGLGSPIYPVWEDWFMSLGEAGDAGQVD